MEEAQQNKKMKTRARTTTEDLNDDTITEILVRLPLKKTAQCRSLNKTFLNRISHPSFVRRYAAVASSSPPLTVFHRNSFHHRTTFTAIDPKTNRCSISTITSGVSIQAVCNGLLLFQYYAILPRHNVSRYFVFNPITSRIIPVAVDALDRHNGVGLAAPVDSHHFKLVALCVKGDENNVLRFVVVVPVGDFAVVKSRVDVACGGGFRRGEDYGQPRVVYSDGELHWMGELGEAMVAFDVDKEEARIVDVPLKNITVPPGVDIWFGLNIIWFGLARGSLTSMYTFYREIVVSSHDRQSREWCVQYKINISEPVCNHIHEFPLGVFFDGERVYVKLSGQIYMNDLLRGRKWKKMDLVGEGSPDDDDGCLIFTAFVPTLAKVSDKDYTLDEVSTQMWKKMDHPNLDLIWIGKDFKTVQDLFRKCST